MSRRRKNLRIEILSFVTRFNQENGYSPTYDEIKEAVGLSSRSHAAYHLNALEQEGFIERTPHVPRGLRLVDVAPDTLALILGHEARW